MPRLVAIDAGGGTAFVEALQHAWSAGDAVLPVDPRLPAAARARLLTALRVGDPVEPGDALVVATSGSTGAPKGAVLTHDALAASARAVTDHLDALDGAGYRWLACLPLAHVGGLGVVTRALLTGKPLTVLGGFDAGAVERVARESDQPVVASMVATVLSRIDASLFQRIVLGGAAPPDRVPANVSTTYGLTETAGGIVYDGVPLAGVDIDVRHDGEIAVRGPMLLRTYRDGRDPRDLDGWLPTGDIGTWDGERLVVAGRRSEMIISGGENVWPAPVEEALRTVAGVADVAVVGRPHHEWGQQVTAIIVPADGMHPPTLRDLRDAVKAVLPPWCAPGALEFVAAIPRTSLGKVRRDQLM